MSWERRLQEMLVAGGTLAAAASTFAACSESASTGKSTGDAGTTKDGSPGGSSGGGSGSSSGGGSGNQCCNANPDPCCPLYCDEGGAVAYDSCEQCETDGGVYFADAGTCSLPHEAGPSDAGADGDAPD